MNTPVSINNYEAFNILEMRSKGLDITENLAELRSEFQATKTKYFFSSSNIVWKVINLKNILHIAAHLQQIRFNGSYYTISSPHNIRSLQIVQITTTNQ